MASDVKNINATQTTEVPAVAKNSFRQLIRGSVSQGWAGGRYPLSRGER
jgi:hypothetical protein